MTGGYGGRDNLEVMLEAENYNRWLVRLITDRANSSDRILDFGAGSGTFANVLAAKGYDVACVEPDSTLRRTLEAAGRTTYATIDDLPPASVDFVYSYNVLEHIESDYSAVGKLADVLRPGGTLLVYVPAFEALYTTMDEKVGHYRRYRRAPLTRLLRQSGLEVLEARYADTLGFLATVGYKAVGASDGSISPTGVRLFDRLIFPANSLLDPIFGRVLGKNLIAVARKPGVGSR